SARTGGTGKCSREALSTSNIQVPASKVQAAIHLPYWKPLVVRCWMLGVGCFPSVRGFKARNVSGNSFLEPTQRFGKDKDGNFNLCLAQIFGRFKRQVHGSDWCGI